MPTPSLADGLPPARYAISPPAATGPRIRARLKVALCSAMALTTESWPTISGMTAERAGMLNDSTVPLKRPK